MKNKKPTSSNRRDFIKKTTLTSAGILGLGGLNAQPDFIAKSFGQIENTPTTPENLTILFQGDSITDAGRSRENYYANQSGGMGNGYVYQIVASLLGKNPTSDLKCYNRGISGHKVFQLANRWEEDCLQIRPDVLSILIGVNDFWHTLSHDYKGTVKTFEDDLRKLLDRTLKDMSSVKLILCEPFAVPGGTAINEKWVPVFYDYQKAVRQISQDYNTAFVPFQKNFDEALKIASVSYWCEDGVHPSIAGAFLMANEWMKVFDKMMK